MSMDGSASVLVVSNSQFISNLISRFLESAGYKVYLVQNGLEAITAAKELLPSVILCSTEIAGVDGFEVLKELSSNDYTNTIPFLFLFPLNPGINDIRKAMSLGADSLIIRPFNAKEMLTIMKNKLDKIRRLKEKGLVEYIYGIGGDNRRSRDDTVLIDFNKKRKLINKNDIEYVTAKGAYTNLFIIGKGQVIVRKLLKEWEKTLTGENFLKIHRSVIININYINNIEKYCSRSLKISMENSNKEFVTSQRYTSRLRAVLKN